MSNLATVLDDIINKTHFTKKINFIGSEVVVKSLSREELTKVMEQAVMNDFVLRGNKQVTIELATSLVSVGGYTFKNPDEALEFLNKLGDEGFEVLRQEYEVVRSFFRGGVQSNSGENKASGQGSGVTSQVEGNEPPPQPL